MDMDMDMDMDMEEVRYVNDTDGGVADMSQDANGNGTIDPVEQVSIAAMICLPIIIGVGVFGNTLVCIAVVKVHKLRTVANSFVVSLAISDLAVCVFVLPFGLYEALNYGSWFLGEALCNTWLSVDIILSTASVWNLCVIAGDRCLAITKPIWYANRRSPLLAGIALAVAWGIPILLTIPSMAIMHLRRRGEPVCYPNVQFSYIIFACVICFFLPCIIVLAVYVRIFMAARDHFMRAPSRVAKRKKSTASSGGVERSMDSLPDSSGNANGVNGKTEYTATTPTGSMGNINSVAYSNVRKISTGAMNDMYVEPPENRQLKRRTSRIPRISVSREKKAAIVLSIVVGAFIVCWLPYFTAVFILAASGGRIVASPRAFVAFSWIGWMNSIINPIIYTVFTKDFRKSFKKILKCQCENWAGISVSSTKSTGR